MIAIATTTATTLLAGTLKHLVLSATPTCLAMSGPSSDMVYLGENDKSVNDLSSSLLSTKVVQPEVFPDEPNLYKFPANFRPTYTKLPVTIKAILLFGSIALPLINLLLQQQQQQHQVHYSNLPVTSSLKNLFSYLRAYSWRRPRQLTTLVKILILTVCKIIILYNGFYFLLQDLFFPPTRISVRKLQSDYFLPSKLSRYDTLQSIPLDDTSTRVDSRTTRTTRRIDAGVHYLEYRLPKESISKRSNNVKLDDKKDENTNTTTSSSNISADSTNVDDSSSHFDALYVNHGFGASSLSWLPAIPVLGQRLKIPLVLGHDTPGFGLTQRISNKYLQAYSYLFSANIGVELLHHKLAGMKNALESKSDDSATNISDNSGKSMLLMGHSMGAVVTLQMALQLDDAHGVNKRTIVLVSPALNSRKLSPESSENSKNEKSSKQSRQSPRRWFYRILDPPCRYALRRFVGQPGFWRRGLSLAWGNKQLLKDSDVLRFQWPSVTRGWEQGLLNFIHGSDARKADGADLLTRVLAMPNTAVHVVLGERDRVVQKKTVDKLIEEFPTIQVVEIPRVGHDSFEEDVQGFTDVIEKLIAPKDSAFQAIDN